jgi:plasmid maintenance system antidote protein VapI
MTHDELRELVRTAMVRRGLNADTLSNLCDVDASMIRRFLAGQRTVTSATLLKVCKPLGVVVKEVRK